MSSNLILGVDPGVSGALAFFQPDTHVAWLFDMPTVKAKRGKSALDVDARDVADKIALAVDSGFRISQCVVELVSSRPRQGGQFSFGTNFGRILGLLEGNGYQVKLVAPSKWKQEMGLRGEDKSASVALAAALFPGLKEQFYGPRGAGLDGRAEAILIAYYGSKL